MNHHEKTRAREAVDPDRVWSTARDAFEREHPDVQLGTWLDNLVPHRVTADALIAYAPSSFIRDYVVKNFGEGLEGALGLSLEIKVGKAA